MWQRAKEEVWGGRAHGVHRVAPQASQTWFAPDAASSGNPVQVPERGVGAVRARRGVQCSFWWQTCVWKSSVSCGGISSGRHRLTTQALKIASAAPLRALLAPRHAHRSADALLQPPLPRTSLRPPGGSHRSHTSRAYTNWTQGDARWHLLAADGRCWQRGGNMDAERMGSIWCVAYAPDCGVPIGEVPIGAVPYPQFPADWEG